MKKLRLRTKLFILLPFLVLSAGVFLFFNPGLLRWEDSGPRDLLDSRETALLEDGDIVLRRGVGLPSDLIISALGEGQGVSHCGFIFHRDGNPWVVHTVSAGLSGIDGVQTQPLEVFNRNSRPDSVVVVRLKPEVLEDRGMGEIRKSAYGYLEKKVPFDGAYDFSDKKKLYCTEFLYQVLKDGGLWTTPADLVWAGPVLGFSNFLSPRWFQVVLDHRR